MKKNEKKTVKAAKVPAKKSAEKPKIKDAKSLFKAIASGAPPRGLKAIINASNEVVNVAFAFGKESIRVEKTDALRLAMKTLGVRIA